MDIDTSMLTEPVRQALETPTAQITDWEHVAVRGRGGIVRVDVVRVGWGV